MINFNYNDINKIDLSDLSGLSLLINDNEHRNYFLGEA
jgi:hypothetical protein